MNTWCVDDEFGALQALPKTYRKFPVGAHVKCVYVDRFGWLGRDYHPVSGKDEGFDGIVVSVEVVADITTGLSVEELGHDNESELDPVYLHRVCRASDGKVLDLLSHEVAPYGE